MLFSPPSRDVQHSLRQRLRIETSRQHQKLDTCMSGFDISTIDGLACALLTHHMALTALEPKAQSCQTLPLIRSLKRSAATDLNRLRVPTLAPNCKLRGDLHPLGIDYVISGSRLGNTILRKRWQNSDVPKVKDANAYFSQPDHIEYWRSFQKRASDTQRDDGTVINTAKTVFSLYSNCAQMAASAMRERLA